MPNPIRRREFMARTAAAGVSLGILGEIGWSATDRVLRPESFQGKARPVEGKALLPGGQWFEAPSINDALVYRFEPGALADMKTLTADFLLDGDELVVFHLRFRAGDEGPTFTLKFALLAQVSARMRMPLSFLDMNRWRLERDGAWLKPTSSGERVDINQVDRMILTVTRKSEQVARWQMTPLVATSQAVPPLDKLILPRGPLVDEMGQCRIRQWPSRTKDVDALKARLQRQAQEAPTKKWPDAWSQWGGWKEKPFQATGYFSRHHDGKRWWLVDPDGYAFWSAGMDCVRVDTNANIQGLESALQWAPDRNGPYQSIYNGNQINYLAANFIRVFGPEQWRDHWKAIALAQLRATGFNTVANWSEWDIARAVRFPYVRPMSFNAKRIQNIYRDFPDVFDPQFAKDAEDYAAQLKETAQDPALIGYFMMNEPTWGFSSELPATGMLFNGLASATRQALVNELKTEYADDAALSKAWDVKTTFADVAEGPWKHPIRKGAWADLEAFSAVMVERYFTTLARACRQADPNHLNLGIRYAGVPPTWATEGMKAFDVFSMNSYTEVIPAENIDKIVARLQMPVMIGEYHFGALDAGLPASGIGRVATQADRGRAYRRYVEDAAAHPACVGAHWFTLYDQSALGRFDGENYQIGFLDVCNRPYPEICGAALKSHRRIYEVAAGTVKPFDDAPKYLSKLF